MHLLKTIQGRVFTLMLLALVLAACSTAQPAATTNTAPPAATTQATQSSEGGQVTITATWNGISSGPAFSIEMNTHAVDLDGYNLQELAIIRVDDNTTLQPSSWDAPKGGHHRKGTLTFPATTADGQPVFGPTTRGVELVIRNVAGVPERILRWTINS